MFDLVTKRGICITRGIGCVQISDQQGNVIEIDYDEVSQIGAKLAFARMQDADEPPFSKERPRMETSARRYVCVGCLKELSECKCGKVQG